MNYFSRCTIVVFMCVLLCTEYVVSESSLEKDLTITTQQKEILDKFRQRVIHRLPHEYMHTDLYLVRWLRAKRFSMDDAEQFLMDNLKWREDNRMDGIQLEDWSDFHSRYPYWLESVDLEGKPILYFNVGSWDIRRAILAGETLKLRRYLDRGVDMACTLVRELSEKYQNVTQGILMVNLEGYNLVEHGCLRCTPIILQTVLNYENHYPGCAEKIITLNTPTVFEPALNAIRQLLNPVTNGALKIFGTNKNEWKKFLLKHIDRDELPFEIGGNKIYEGMLDYA